MVLQLCFIKLMICLLVINLAFISYSSFLQSRVSRTWWPWITGKLVSQTHCMKRYRVVEVLVKSKPCVVLERLRDIDLLYDQDSWLLVSINTAMQLLCMANPTDTPRPIFSTILVDLADSLDQMSLGFWIIFPVVASLLTGHGYLNF